MRERERERERESGHGPCKPSRHFHAILLHHFTMHLRDTFGFSYMPLFFHGGDIPRRDVVANEWLSGSHNYP